MAKTTNKKIESTSALKINIESMITAFILAMLIRAFIICPFKIPSGSMEPTLHGHPTKGDRILVNRFIYFFKEPRRGDIVVFKTRGIEGLDWKKDFIKRLVGLPGETVTIKYNRLYINGEKLTEPDFFKDKKYTFDKYKMRYGNPLSPVKIPEDSYFVLGDNTENSSDGRFWGFVPKKNVTGKAILKWWPPKRMGMLK